MDDLVNFLNNFTHEELLEIINKAERKEKLNNFEISLIYRFMKWYERRKNV